MVGESDCRGIGAGFGEDHFQQTGEEVWRIAAEICGIEHFVDGGSIGELELLENYLQLECGMRRIGDDGGADHDCAESDGMIAGPATAVPVQIEAKVEDQRTGGASPCEREGRARLDEGDLRAQAALYGWRRAAAEIARHADRNAIGKVLHGEVEIPVGLVPKQRMPFLSGGQTADGGRGHHHIEEAEEGFALVRIAQNGFELAQGIVQPAGIEIAAAIQDSQRLAQIAQFVADACDGEAHDFFPFGWPGPCWGGLRIWFTRSGSEMDLLA